MALTAKQIPDSEIKQTAATSRSIYYQIGKSITVISVPCSVGYRFTCLTCVTTDSCVHTRAVRRFCGQPLTEEKAVA